MQTQTIETKTTNVDGIVDVSDETFNAVNKAVEDAGAEIETAVAAEVTAEQAVAAAEQAYGETPSAKTEAALDKANDTLRKARIVTRVRRQKHAAAIEAAGEPNAIRSKADRERASRRALAFWASLEPELAEAAELRAKLDALVSRIGSKLGEQNRDAMIASVAKVTQGEVFARVRLMLLGKRMGTPFHKEPTVSCAPDTAHHLLSANSLGQGVYPPG